MEKRPPIVTVLGHVDHGKTTLLDAIRKTNIAAREAGGITQGIGASEVNTPSGQITFVDTPGHAAFSSMRARGAKIADIVLLVVAADDGLMPQTREALRYIKENSIPMIVVFTKTDLPSANVERARGQLEQEEIFFEGRGGSTSSVEVAAREGRGIKELLELITLMAEVNEVSADPEAPLEAYVIETNKDKRGVMVSVVVRAGTLRVGDDVSAEAVSARVKGLFDSFGKSVKSVTPGMPVAILGFTQSPEVGAKLVHGTVSRQEEHKKGVKKVGKGQIGIVLKATTAGALEAILASLSPDVVVLDWAIGEVTESDVFFAKTAGAMILTFEAKVPAQVKKLAETEDVEISEFKIIYELMEYADERVKAGHAVVLGRAEILASFPFNKTLVAGCKVMEGRINKTDKVTLMRGETELGRAKIVSMRRGKNELSEARAGEECGVIISPLLQFAKGDILVAIK